LDVEELRDLLDDSDERRKLPISVAARARRQGKGRSRNDENGKNESSG